ncbi:MAG: response regulator transcription factor [Synergistales bacterium]|nr:response regulator transcription factor [Synergistales bacterium]
MAEEHTKRLLLIEDDRELCGLLGEYLEGEGFAVECVHEGDEGLRRALDGGHHLVVLDLMLPGLPGLDLLRSLRGRSSIPVLILTARGDDVDRILGLELGADDYLPKPCNPRELAARIRSILRRTLPTEGRQARIGGDLTLSSGAYTAWLGERQLELTTTEFKILEVLFNQAGGVCSRQALSRNAMGRPLTPFDRTIDVHVSNLRKKLGPHPDGTERIRTIRGEGYMYTFPHRGEDPHD